jgi:hypothetical protein
MSKDWSGNSNSIYKTLGASNHTKEDREENDYYATSPSAAKMIIKMEKLNNNIWECSAGEKHLSNVFEESGYNVRSSDLIVRTKGVEKLDFLSPENNGWSGVDSYDILTNPPYKYSREFVEKAMNITPIGCKVIMFLKLQFLEGKARKILFEKYPPKTIWVSSSRITCAKNGDFKSMKDGGGSAVCYAFFVWEVGFKGVTSLKWFN